MEAIIKTIQFVGCFAAWGLGVWHMFHGETQLGLLWMIFAMAAASD